jgi:hypothetical protein
MTNKNNLVVAKCAVDDEFLELRVVSKLLCLHFNGILQKMNEYTTNKQIRYNVMQPSRDLHG